MFLGFAGQSDIQDIQTHITFYITHYTKITHISLNRHRRLIVELIRVRGGTKCVTVYSKQFKKKCIKVLIETLITKQQKFELYKVYSNNYGT